MSATAKFLFTALSCFCGVLLIQGPIGVACAAQVSIGAPVSCKGHDIFNRPISCGEDVTLAEAEKSARKEATKSRKLVAKVENYAPCDQTGDDGPYVWAHPVKILDGQHALNSLLAHAKTGETFGREYDRRQIVAALPQAPDQQHLALCTVSNQGGPRDCVTVAILTKEKIWLRALSQADDSAPFGCPAAAVERISGAIGINYEIHTTQSPSIFASALRQALVVKQALNPILERYTDSEGKVYSVRLESSAPLRDSTVLSLGWRESYNFDVYLGRKNQKGPPSRRG
jgi:hypothetical protein